MGTVSENLIQRAKEVTPGGVHSTIRRVREPLFTIKSGKGAYLWDLDGKRYIDYNAAWGANILGYANPEVQKAVTETAVASDLYGLGATEYEVGFCERIKKHVPEMEKILVATSGSEATFQAIRVARAHTGRQKIIKFQGAFHGWHDSVLRNLYGNFAKMYQRDPGSAGMLDFAVDATLICRYNDLESVAEAVKNHPGQIAALILEPVAHNLGAVRMGNEFIQGLRRLCDENGMVFIFDEVITGFRVGLGSYAKTCGVSPDLITMGKALANGYPIAVLGGKAKLMDRFNTHPEGDVSFQGTYNGHPVCLAAGIATLDFMERHNVHQRLFEAGARLSNGLQEIFDRLDIQATVLSYGSIMAPIWVRGPIKCQDDFAKADMTRSLAFRSALVERGHLFPPAEPKRVVVSYAHSDADIDETLQAAEDILRQTK
ncbi:MAG: aspartate aminotransferase family protein [Planctomycetes bacterium]|nr:aspartate aminotransferase family protein [Planctomycetota bacterium]